MLVFNGAGFDMDVFEVVSVLMSEGEDGLFGIGRKITRKEAVWGTRDAVSVGWREGRREKVEMRFKARRRGRTGLDRPWSEIVGHRHLG